MLKINVKSCTYYFFDEMINIDNPQQNKIKMKSHAKIFSFISLDM